MNVPALEKLLDYAASGVGAIAGPMLANWRAHKEGRAKLTSARYAAEIRGFEANSGADSLSIIAEAQSKARQSIESGAEPSHGIMEITNTDISQSIEFQGRKRIANVRSIIEDAAEELGDESVSDREPDHDWTARFFDSAQDVSSEDMRRVWSKILAGEVRKPGQTSLRAIETLRHMTEIDARIFRDFCDFVIDGEFVFCDFKTPTYSPLSFGMQLHLKECGMISSDSPLVRKVSWDESAQAIFTCREGLLVINRNVDQNEDLSLKVIKLTSVGKELFNVVDTRTRIEYLQVFSKYLNQLGHQLDYLEGLVHLSEELVRYARRTRIQPLGT